MPYITKEERKKLTVLVPESAGQLNYKITLECIGYAETRGQSYQTYNDIIGALEAAKLEFYRKMVSDYEDAKIKENGEVYPKTLIPNK